MGSPCRGLLLPAVVSLCLLAPREAYQRGDVVSTLARTQHAGWRTAWTEVLRAEMPRFRQDTPAAAPLKLKLPAPHEGVVPGEAFKLSLAYSDNKFVVPWLMVSDGHGRLLKGLLVTFLYSGTDIVQVKWGGDYEEVTTTRKDEAAREKKEKEEEKEKKKKKKKKKKRSKGDDDDEEDDDEEQEGENAKGKGGSQQEEESYDDDAAGGLPNDALLPRELPLRYEWYEVVEHDVESGLVTMFGLSLLAALSVLCITCGRDEFNVSNSHDPGGKYNNPKGKKGGSRQQASGSSRARASGNQRKLR